MSYKSKAASGGDETPELLHCRKCNALASRETLAMLGAQCHPCYATYCREAQRNYRDGMPDTPAVADMKTRIRGRLHMGGLPQQRMAA